VALEQQVDEIVARFPGTFANQQGDLSIRWQLIVAITMAGE
jgi:hypothetical protein